MPLSTGERLGPYEILAPLGAGGMGEVYRARDPRIGRDVAIKVLHAHVVNDPDRLRRFEQEVKASGALNHPNVLVIYDVGTQDGAPYIVSELLEGETLRQRLASGSMIGERRTIEYGIGVARGLAAAHEKGIVHRDLKPENIFLTKDGRVKILDFGLAKLSHTPSDRDLSASTMTIGTESGVVMGTPGYMAPEQVNGLPVDHRADIFCFGCVLYEMLSEKRAFRRDTMPETLTAILKEDPPPLENASAERIVRRCLEKDPGLRFQSAADLAFALETLVGAVSTILPVQPQPPRSRRWIAAVAIALLLAAASLFVTRRFITVAPPVFRQLTFRRGAIYSARFAPDGHTIIYGGYWDGKPPQLYSTRPENPESSTLPLPSADLLSISSTGEMAIARDRRVSSWVSTATLARVPLEGGAPRDVMENVQEAVWDHQGSALAVIRASTGEGGHKLEYPPGKVLYETQGWISHPRFSPKGDQIAFMDHPYAGDDIGHLAVVDLAGKKRDLTQHYGGGAQGVAWSPSGDEVWYTAADVGTNMELMAVKASGGTPRILARIAGRMTLQDVYSDGRILLTRDTLRPGVIVSTADNPRERDLAWLDSSVGTDISPDGKTLLIAEQGVAGGPHYSVYVRKSDGSPAVRIGEGNALALAPDGRWALTQMPTSPPQMIVLPTGAGEARVLPRGNISSYLFAGGWFPDGHRIVFSATEPGHQSRTYVQDVNGGDPKAVTGEGAVLIIAAGSRMISPDQRWITAIGADNILRIYPAEAGEPRNIPGLEPLDVSAGWSADGSSLYIYRVGEPTPVKVYLVNVTTGQKKLWKEIVPADAAGTSGILLQVSPDGKSYMYDMWRELSDLYLVEGLK
jgi:eukaryotic-like serine/threonine-protein kinase